MVEVMTQETFDSDALTVAQREAMRELQKRSSIPWDSFLAHCIPPTPLCPYVGVMDFYGMFVGIEKDGYTHT